MKIAARRRTLRAIVSAMRIGRLAPVVGVLALLAPAGAAAHPLGNFTVNHLVKVRVGSQRVDVRYTLDEAEIPTFQERGLSAPAVLARKLAEVRRGLSVTEDGRAVALTFAAPGRLTHPPGQGGLPLTRVELVASATVKDPRRVLVHDATFPGRLGWKAVIVAPGNGTDVRSDVPVSDPTKGLRSYPTDLLKSPSEVRDATLVVRPGDGTVQAPDGRRSTGKDEGRSGDGFAGVFERARDGKGVFLLLLLAAFAWGAIHALSPGHGKTMVAAYLVGQRGRPRHALALGLVVTLTHTAGVFALGFVTLALSAYILPEQLYPWLNLVSGLLVVGIGASVLRSRIRWGRARREVAAPHAHEHPHPQHAHVHTHSHDHDHDHSHGHGPGQHSHDVPAELSPRTLVVMGMSAGLVPCPSALVVLLAALTQHEIVLGLVLILAFSAGLATTLSAIGLAVVSVRGVGNRLSFGGRLGSALPALSTLLIVGLGLVLTARAIPGVI